MDCRDIQKMFIPFINEELSIKDLGKFLEHIDRCRDCREEYDIYYTMIMGMRYLESENNKTEFKINSEQKLREAEEHILKHKLFQIGKVVLLIIICVAVIIVL